MIRFRPLVGQKSIYDVFKTSPGRINPRTGKLVQEVEYSPLAPWEEEGRSRGRGRSRDDFESEDRPWSRRDDDRFRDYAPLRRDDDERSGRSRRSLADVFRSSMSGYNKPSMGNVGEFFGNAVPWVFLGVAAIVALEASGITNISPRK